MRTTLKRMALRLLRWDPSPPAALTDEQVSACETLYAEMVQHGPGWLIDYQLDLPKWLFLDYLVRTKRVMLHGSANGQITELEPREQTDFNGRPIRAVFATPSPIYPIYFAILDKATCSHLRNGAALVGDMWYYFFSIPRTVLYEEPFVAGTIYILPGETFRPSSVSVEYHSPVPVKPLARLSVTAADFPLLHRLEGHGPQAGWFGYNWRRIWHEPARRGTR